jgi:DNA-directed RNA polymerase specialized sigma24 family protein
MKPTYDFDQESEATLPPASLHQQRQEWACVQTRRPDRDLPKASHLNERFPPEEQRKNSAMIESGPQEGNRMDLTPLLAKARRGDPSAFDKLMQAMCPHILGVLRKQGAAPDDAEDALSKAMIIIHRLLTQNRFDAMQTGGFIAYFRKVALHEWLHRPEARRAMQTVPLSVTDRDTGETIELDVMDDSPTIADKIANLSLYEFLLQQLDEVFVAGRSGADRCRGELEKLAFVYFYQDGITQNEIFDILSVLSGNFPQMTPITRADLNNWLSMGRSLKALLKHLAEHHAEIVGMLVELHLNSLQLPANVSDTLRLVYREGRSLAWIADQRGVDIADARRELAAGKKELIEGLARTIKAQLKVSRSG